MELPAEFQAAHDAAQALFETLREIYEIRSRGAVQRYMKEPLGAVWVMGGKKGPPPPSWCAALKKLAVHVSAWGSAIENIIPRLPRANPTKPLENCVAATHCGTLLEVSEQLMKRAEHFAGLGEASFVSRDFFNGGDLTIKTVDVSANWIEFLAVNMGKAHDAIEWKELWLAIEGELETAATKEQFKIAVGEQDILSQSFGINGSKPQWSRRRETLFFDGKVVKRIRVAQARNVAYVLDHFERDKWPQEMDDPLPVKTVSTIDPKRRVRDTVASLNDRQDILRFSSTKGGQAFAWAATGTKP